jgi:hypothetical protein
MQGVPTHKMKSWGVHAMHPASHLAVAGLPRHQGGGWSLIPACLRLSLVTSAPGVGHGHQTENMTKSAIWAKELIFGRVFRYVQSTNRWSESHQTGMQTCPYQGTPSLIIREESNNVQWVSRNKGILFYKSLQNVESDNGMSVLQKSTNL